MAKNRTKKPLLIPFHGATGNMLTWQGYGSGPEEPGPQGTMWCDIEKARKSRWEWAGREHPPNPAHKPSETVRVQVHKVSRDQRSHSFFYDRGEWVWEDRPNELYEEQMERWKQRLAEWESLVASGTIKEYPETIWRENYEFDATLEIIGTFRGRSAARFILRNTEGERETYEMMMTLVEDLLVNGKVSKGKVTGRWTFVKKGANYSLKPVFENPKTLEEVTEESPEQSPPPKERTPCRSCGRTLDSNPGEFDCGVCTLL